MVGKISWIYLVMFVLFFVLGLGAAIATFIENDFGSESAKILVYHASWYAVIFFALCVIMLIVAFTTKMWKKRGGIIFHLGFIVILLGAFITRYFGYEGVIHIREGKSEHLVISESSYLQVFADKKSYEHKLSLTKLGDNNFKFTDTIRGKEFVVEFKDYKFSKNSNIDKLTIKATYDGVNKEATINGGHGSIEAPATLSYKDIDIQVAWGSKLIELPFSLTLIDFEVLRYPGSQSPSSFSSEVILIDNQSDKTIDQKISMNNPLSYKGFKFFQSSYDKDELGTILSVNNDPGKVPTYIGYAMLVIGFILNFFSKGSRFFRLIKFVQSGAVLFALLGTFFGTSLQADELSYLEKLKQNSLTHSKKYGELLVQDYNGRIKPLHTEAIDVLHKISGKDKMLGLSPTQIMLGIFANPLTWENIKIIKIKNQDIKKHLKLPLKQKFISFSEIFNENGEYKLRKEIEKANAKNPSKRGTYEKDLIKFDERLNIFFLASKGFFSKIIPNANDTKHTWYSPQDSVKSSWLDGELREDIYLYHRALSDGISQNDWEQADKILEKIKAYQLKHGEKIVPNQMQIKVEILSNNLKIFQNMLGFYFLFGFIVLLLAIYSLFSQKELKKLNKIAIWIYYAAFFTLSLGLLMRWFISNHAPWSDTYESLVYIAWSSALAGIVARRSFFVLSASSILAGIFLLVAHLSFISPQITPLVPVLKSYWLSIHVSVITASYGFLGLGAILGFMVLFLMVARTDTNKIKLDKQIRQLVAINEISLMVGLALLTIGTFLGGVWANESWGRYWGWDPKETWSFISIVVYTVVIHLNLLPKLNTAYVLSLASVIAFASIVMTYFGVNFYLSGLHSYASGDSVAMPSFIYYIGALVAFCAIFAFKARDIKGIK